MRFIPRKTRVKMQVFRSVTIWDVIIGMIELAIAIALLASNLPYKWFLLIAWLGISVALFIPIAEGVRTYASFILIFKYLAYPKKYSKLTRRKYNSMSDLIPYNEIIDERFISYNREYYAEVLELRPVEFFMLNEFKQNMMIETVGNALKRLGQNQQASIVKISKAMLFDKYLYAEERKYDNLMELQSEGQMTAEEVDVRSHIFEARLDHLKSINSNSKIFKDCFYIVVYDKDREQLDVTIQGMQTALRSSSTPLYCDQLKGRELAIFLKANYGKDFDEREVDLTSLDQQVAWATPDTVEFKLNRTIIDGKAYRSFVITDYPVTVPNGWGYTLFNLDKTKVVVNIKPIPKFQAEKQIDKAILEMETQGQYSRRSSKQIEYATHLETLKELLTDLKNANEELYDINFHITCEDSVRKEVRALLRQNGFRFSDMFGRQVDEFVSTNISRRDNIKDYWRGIQTSSVAGMFPFISNALQDDSGFYLGYNTLPVFVDFFRRDDERVNSNMIVIGKSGSGKSYATKVLLTNLAADNTRIFILDPEDEYKHLVHNLNGKLIDVGSSRNGILNPFHINTTLQANDEADLDEEEFAEHDEEGNVIQGAGEKHRPTNDSYSLHLQFLEEFFRIIMEGMPSDAFEIMNSLVADCYTRKNIGPYTDVDKLKPEDFPIFDDLYQLVLEKIKTEKNEYLLRNYQIIETYVKKFATGGRNSNLWNGPTSVQTSENFVTFSFLSLLSNRNMVIANAQMLLVFKYVENEIIRNKDYNDMNDANRKIVFAVDEAHTFINPKYPMALDFMAQMAKRIRKYNGMQIIITQNIKDFVGSPDMARQSSAVINASQYSLIFSLAPNDITDLVALYQNAGEINEDEQDTIVTAGRGEGFIITGALSRTTLKIDALPEIEDIFMKDKK